MKKSLLSVVAVLSLLALPFNASAAEKKSLQLPITGAIDGGGSFVGTFSLQRFAASGDEVNAVGTLTGILTDANGVATTVFRTVSIPANVGGTSAAAITAQATCDILHLELGPLDLDLLGLVVHLNQIVLDIDAQSGPGNLLGNLLCGVTGLLDNPTGLAQLLNQILGALLG